MNTGPSPNGQNATTKMLGSAIGQVIACDRCDNHVLEAEAKSGLGDACVCPHREVHADETGCAGKGRPDHEANRGLVVLKRDQRDGQNNGDASDDRVLPGQIGARSLLDGA